MDLLAEYVCSSIGKQMESSATKSVFFMDCDGELHAVSKSRKRTNRIFQVFFIIHIS